MISLLLHTWQKHLIYYTRYTYTCSSVTAPVLGSSAPVLDCTNLAAAIQKSRPQFFPHQVIPGPLWNNRNSSSAFVSSFVHGPGGGAPALASCMEGEKLSRFRELNRLLTLLFAIGVCPVGEVASLLTLVCGKAGLMCISETGVTVSNCSTSSPLSAILNRCSSCAQIGATFHL